MRYFQLLLFSLLPTIIIAQTSFEFDKYQVDKEFSPYQINIPFEFQFLIEDELQSVLFNPSKIGTVDGDQVYWTIDPGNRNNFRLVGLFSNEWLFSLSANSITSYTDNFSDNLDRITLATGTLDEFQVLEREQVNQVYDIRENPTNSFEFRLAKSLSNSENFSSSVGGTISYTSNKNFRRREITQNLNDQNSFVRNDTLIRIDNLDITERSLNLSNDDYDKFFVSVEYYTSRNNSEGYHTFFLQKTFRNDLSTTEFSRNSVQNENDILANTITNQKVTVLDTRYTKIDSDPLLLGYSWYKNKKLDWLGEDFLFFSFEANYAFDKAKYTNNLVMVQNVELNTVITQNDSDISNNVFDREDWQGTGRLSLGYSISKRIDDVYLFTGFNPHMVFLKNKFRRITSTGLVDLRLKQYQYGVTIPVFSELAISKNLSIWGGGNFFVNYTKTDSEQKTGIPFLSSALNQEIIEKQITDSKDMATSQFTYLGVTARHKSGFKLIADLNGDLGRFSGWLVTIGYNFKK